MTAPTLLEIRDLYYAYDGHPVLRGINLRVETNQRWAVIGKNGTGKSTMVKAIAALIRPSSGEILLKGRSISSYRSRQRATVLAYVPQKPEAVIPYTVYDYLMLGRYASMGLFGIPGQEDYFAVDDALGLCDVKNLSSRLMTTLSGGELQRVLLAGAVAQKTPLLLLDEPTTFLDPAHERLFFRALERVQEHRELTFLMVTHDINSAIASCTHICTMQDGVIAFAGTINEMKELCPDFLHKLFDVPFNKYHCKRDDNAVFGTWGVVL